MPDWITHLGTTYLATQAAVRVRPALGGWVDRRWVLLGTLLPDATRFVVILVDGLDWPAIPTFTYFIPFHSLPGVALLAGALALLLPAGGRSSRRAFGLLLAGAVVHFFLDDFEGGIGCGSTTFYPFSFGQPAIAWPAGGPITVLPLVVSALALGLALARPLPGPLFRPVLTPARLLAALALLGLAALLPLPFRQHMVEANAYAMGFVTRPAAFEGRAVALCFSEVIATEPLTIEEFDRPFVLDSPVELAQGEWISVRGVYQAGVIHTVSLVRHRAFEDVILSLVAMIAFIVLIFRSGGA